MADKSTSKDLYYLSDGAYRNFITGLGDESMDKDESTRVVCGVPVTNYDALAAQYVKDGIVKRIARDPAVKSLKAPIVIADDKDDKTFKALSKIGFFKACRNAGTWANLFGGAIVVSIYDGDGDADLEKPAGSKSKVVGYRVYTPGRIDLTESCICSDPESEWFGKVEKFPVQVRTGTIVHIHASRCHIFRGVEAPDLFDTDIRTYIFGTSEVDMANVGLKKLPPAFGAVSNMLQENGLSVFSLKDFSMMLASEGGLRKAQERMSIVKLGMSTMRAVFQDKEDAFEMKSHSMSDVPESIKMLMAYTSALTGIPVSILFGNMVSGLSSTNDGDIRQYNDLVEQWRNDCLYEPMVEMITEFRNRNEGVSGIQDFTFGELSQSTEAEKADLFEKKVNSCKTLFEMGSMTPKEARENLIVNGGTSELSVKGTDVPAQPQNAPTGATNAE
jgi:phage-related protein (TIGR01555 family)